MAAMGAAHRLWIHGFKDHPIPEAARRAQTDNLQALQNRHHHRFGMGDVQNPGEPSSNCTDVDCMTVLVSNFHRQDYRRRDLHALLQFDGHLFARGPGQPPGPVVPPLGGGGAQRQPGVPDHPGSSLAANPVALAVGAPPMSEEVRDREILAFALQEAAGMPVELRLKPQPFDGAAAAPTTAPSR